MATGQSPLPPGGRNFKIGGRSLSAAERTWLLAQLNIPEIGTLTISDVTDATAAGQAMVTAATATAQKVLLAIPKIYRATLTQTSTTAPVATVLENTLSAAVVWARTSQGFYTGTLASAFTANKTFVRVVDQHAEGVDDAGVRKITITLTSTNVITISTGDGTTQQDGQLTVSPIEILVYP